MMPGRIRSAAVLSVVLHAALFLLPVRWWDETPGGDPASGGSGPFTVSLFEPSPKPGPAAPVVAEPVEAEPEPEPEAEPEPEPEPEPVIPEPTPTEPVVARIPATPAPAAPGSTRAGSPGGTATGPSPGTGTEAGSEIGTGKAPFRPPRLLAGALPIDPEDSEDLEVPPEIPVRLWIGTDGSVLRLVPQIEDLPPAVLSVLEESARNMQFIPASRDGRPVEAWFSMSFVFRH